MQYSWLPQERRQVTIREKPPLVISLQRYGRLQWNANQLAREKQLHRQQQQQRYEEQLRLGGEELLRQFAGRKLCRTQQEQCFSAQRRQKQEQEQTKQSSQEASLAEQREEQRRQRERIEKAQQLLEQLRPGPRELLCAKLQSEVMRGVNVQRQLQSQIAAAAEQQRTLDKRIYGEQVLNGLEEAQMRHCEQRRQLGEHKRDLLQSIKQRQEERNAAKAKELEIAQQERQRNEQQLKEQLDKERAAQAHKLQQRREHALAALEATEQRQQRLQMLEEVEQMQCDVHNEAKAKLDSLKIDQARQRVQRRLQRNEQLAKELAPRLHYSAGEDQARHVRQLDEMRRAHSVEQQTRRQRLEKVKSERLAMQRAEQQQAELAKEKAKNERREDVERRLQNELIHVQFKRQQRQEQLRRQHELRAQLDKQQQQLLEEQARPDTNYNRLAQLECLREDAFFVDYAHRLMAEAHNKNCPLKPFWRVVEQYKRENRIGAEIQIPPHLITKLTMGRRTKGDSLAEKEQQEKQKNTEGEGKDQPPNEEEKYMKNIKENLKKIEALVLAEAKQKAETVEK
ncbi:trichohyalin [Drosophila innubila]|uniref:trichohyalin n=1 Tax=Drosophila innubila TaxID=198719 RepID=UPI00148BA781|nr:trichohyalin [Drosophila innubila]